MHSYQINIEKDKVKNIIKRIRNYPWDKTLNVKSWEMGTNKKELKGICDYWTTKYSWKKEEKKLNKYNHFKSIINNLNIHFIYIKSSSNKSIPLLLSHGWPGSIVEFLKIIEPLTNPEKYGIDKALSFDVVAPSIPGFIFSEAPKFPIGPRKIAKIYNNLMTKVLGYDKYIAQGGDWGSAISSWLGFDYAKHCMGIHLNVMIMRDKNGALDNKEKQWQKRFLESQILEKGYRSLQSSKPQTLAYAMIDSPVGVAAWIIEKFHSWSDLRKSKFLEVYNINDLITNIMLYLVTDSFNTSTWIYYGRRIEGGRILNYNNKKVMVPTACAIFPKEFLPWPPKSYVKRLYNVTQWKKFSDGGHFAAMENPKELINDIRNFSIQFR
ncbi:MAG: epoxide hydrolase [Rickettsiales bacterium]|nr:epoxide hydrolase [Rickettsiales bacterium]